MTEEIRYLTHQDPVFIKQGEGSNGSPPLAGKARERSDHYSTIADEIIKGKQPDISSGKDLGNKWLKGQIASLSANGHLTEEPEAYYVEKRKERVLGYNPIPHNYIFDKKDFVQKLDTQGVKYVRVAGDRYQLLTRQRIAMEKQIDSANATVAIPGDLYALKEMLYILDQKLKGEMLDHPLIIENPVNAANEGFWDEVLRGIKIMDIDEEIGTEQHHRRQYVDFKALAHHYGIYISEDRDTTLQIAKAVTPQSQPVETLNIKALIPNNAVLFVATGTTKKYDEFKNICAANGVTVKIREIFELVDEYVSPEEASRTYEGNTAEKIKAAFNAWNAMPPKKRAAILEKLELEENQIFILAEDSGFHFLEKDLGDENSFRNIRQDINLKAPFPGVETGPSTIGSDGIQGFMKNIHRIFVRRAAKRQSTDDRVIKKSVIALAPLEQPDRGKVNMTMVGSEVHGRITFTPMPSNGAIEIDNYLIPDVVPGAKRNQTEAQLKESFFNYHSPRALAMQALALETGMTLDRNRCVEDDFSKDFCAGIVVDDHSYASKHQAEQLERTAHNDGFGVITAPARFSKASDIQTEVLSKSNGVIFAFDPARAKEEFWRNVYLFTSMIVGEQTHDKYKMRKPFYIVNPNGEFDYLESLVNDCHHQGTVAEDPSTLFKSVRTIDEAVEKLKVDRKQYRYFHLPDYAIQKEPGDLEGRRGTKDFNVAIFCSATNKNLKYKTETRHLSELLIKEDFGLVSGGGLFSMMGEITDAVHSMRKSHRAEHLASNVPHIMPGEGDAREKTTEFLLARNIYERMEYMMDKSDAFAVMVGGTGTIQEFALLALLKKRAVEMDDPYAKTKMANKEIVIINSQMDTQNRGFYDKLKELIDTNDPEACEKLGIHFVKNSDEAMEHFRELRTKKRAANPNAKPMRQTSDEAFTGMAI